MEENVDMTNPDKVKLIDFTNQKVGERRSKMLITSSVTCRDPIAIT